MIWAVITWIVFGLIVGAIARLIMPGRQNLGCLLTIGLGIVGSFVGGAIASMFVGMPQDGIQPAGWIMSILGAIVVLAIYGWLTKGHPRP